MINKIERGLDDAFKELRIEPRTYHFLKDVEPFTAITIVEDRLTWAGVRRELDKILPRLIKTRWPFSPATRLFTKLRKNALYGVAICDRRDTFNRQRGRIIAKGRLLKHLKKELKWEREKDEVEVRVHMVGAKK